MLNSEQEKAAHHFEGPLLVLAGAGSGKTRVLSSRISFLLDKGVLPENILAVTFTNKAADEMKRRIFKETNKNILACTFHSLGAKILRESIPKLGYSREFSIYDSEDALAILKSVFTKENIKIEKSFLRETKDRISSAKNHLLPPEFFSKDPLFVSLYSHYQKSLKEANSVDFDDLLFLPVTLLKEHKDVRETLQNRWQFLLIDEYQDTNIAQHLLAKILVEKHQNLFVVGDPDQAIYSWRGATSKNILSFDNDFPNTKIIYLEQNYRSTSTILQAANHLITYNKSRFQKNLFSDLGEGEKIVYNSFPNDKEEALFIAKEVISLQKTLPLSEIAILYRTNAQSRVLEDCFRKERIPHIIYGGLSFYQRKEIKDLVAYLRLVQTDHDTLAFSRTISLIKRGIGPALIEKLLNLAAEKKLSILTVCKYIVDGTLSFVLSAKQKEGLKEYLQIIYSLRASLKEKDLVSFLIEVIEKTRYIEVLKEDPISFNDRKENVDELINKANDYLSYSLETFLEELSLLTSSDEKAEINSVKFMTLHNAKGLEFHTLFLIGLEEELFPHANADIEEERRLCYVGITRAKQKLFLSGCMERLLWKGIQKMRPSRFLKEIPKELFSQKKECEEVVDTAFSVGDIVMHQVFGIGKIEKCYQSSFGATFDIFFEESLSSRSIVEKYAKLKKVSNHF